jgi:hypothetical protein
MSPGLVPFNILFDKIDAFASELLSERRKLLDLFVEHRRLLLGVCRPQFKKIRR